MASVDMNPQSHSSLPATQPVYWDRAVISIPGSSETFSVYFPKGLDDAGKQKIESWLKAKASDINNLRETYFGNTGTGIIAIGLSAQNDKESGVDSVDSLQFINSSNKVSFKVKQDGEIETLVNHVAIDTLCKGPELTIQGNPYTTTNSNLMVKNQNYENLSVDDKKVLENLNVFAKNNSSTKDITYNVNLNDGFGKYADKNKFELLKTKLSTYVFPNSPNGIRVGYLPGQDSIETQLSFSFINPCYEEPSNDNSSKEPVVPLPMLSTRPAKPIDIVKGMLENIVEKNSYYSINSQGVIDSFPVDLKDKEKVNNALRLILEHFNRKSNDIFYAAFTVQGLYQKDLSILKNEMNKIFNNVKNQVPEAVFELEIVNGTLSIILSVPKN